MPPVLVWGKIHHRSARERALPWILASVLLAVLIFLSLREDYWGDEGYTISRLAAPWPQLLSPGGSAPGVIPDPFDRTEVFDLNPPIYFVLIRLALGPEAGALGIRMFSILPTIAVFLIMAWWAGRVLGRRAQWSLMAACLLSPAMLYYGHEARPYALALLFALPALCATWSARPRAGPVFGLHLLGTLLGCLTNLYFLWWVIAEGIILSFFAAQPREPIGRKTALAGIGGLASGGLLASLFMLSQRALFESAKGRTRLSLT
ncbi:hypothetical protein IIC65_01660, partial [Candidatus Sumerlaeota bacterium]|nr:hypothetical protein [Candidatus Sumerlaeota bacterium]